MTKKVSLWILGLLPIFFLPITQNYYETNKWILLAVGALYVLLVWAITLFRVKTPLHASFSWGAIGFLALAITSGISLVVSSTNRIEALLSPFGLVTWLSLTVLVLAASDKKQEIPPTWFLYIGTGILGLVALYQSIGIGQIVAPRAAFLADPLWTPTGSITTTLALFLIILSLLLPETVTAYQKHASRTRVALLTIASLLVMIATVITVVRCIPYLPTMLPWAVGWNVVTQIFNNPMSAVAGFGAENFLTAFTLGRPGGMTTTFPTNIGLFFHMLTIYGVSGLLGLCILVAALTKHIKKTWVACISLLVIPPTLSLLAVIAIVLVIHSKPREISLSMKPWLRIGMGVALLAAITGSLYLLTRAYTAELYFFQSLRATQATNGTKAYALQIQAMKQNMYISRFHVVYSQTNVSLANSVQDDPRLASQLISQAVREAKTAVALNPQNVTAWENLGLTYQTIIPVASDAASWALTAYQTAAKLDPSNAVLYVTIGSVFVQQQQYDNAIAAFAQAIRLRPTYANAYYNLAHVYTLTGDTVRAAEALTKTMELVPPGSTDYAKAQNDLNALQEPIHP